MCEDFSLSAFIVGRNSKINAGRNSKCFESPKNETAAAGAAVASLARAERLAGAAGVARLRRRPIATSIVLIITTSATARRRAVALVVMMRTMLVAMGRRRSLATPAAPASRSARAREATAAPAAAVSFFGLSKHFELRPAFIFELRPTINAEREKSSHNPHNPIRIICGIWRKC